MANIESLHGSDKLREAYPKVNRNFNAIDKEVTDLRSRVNNIITTPIDGEAAAQEVVDARNSAAKSKIFDTLDARLEEIEQDNASVAQVLDAHKADNAAHGATSEATGNRMMLRDADGRVKFNSDRVLQNLGISFYDAVTSDYTTGQTIISEKILENAGVYLLFTKTSIGANSTIYGMYLVGVQGTQKNVKPILEDTGGISVSINADNKLEITNTSGSNRSINLSLVRVR